MRLIGHKLLSCIGDDSSRVSTVTRTDQSYTLTFEQVLSINPSDLELIVSEVMETHNISENYWVEVYSCEPRALQHSYQVGPKLGTILTCDGRIMPSSCYEVVITLYKPEKDLAQDNSSMTPLMAYIPMLLIVGIGIFYFYVKRMPSEQPQGESIETDLITIGNSILDRKNMRLSFNKMNVDLSHKEVDLLQLLHASENTVVDRKEILKKIWDDDGDYVGRTLDVFISRLRKKLLPDQSIKIMTIRGIGYKMVIGD